MLSKTPPPFAISGSNSSVSRGTVVFSNSNGVSFGLNGSIMTASHNALTTARASTDAIGLNTAQTNVTWTVNSSGLSLNAGGYAGTGFTSTTTAGTQVKATNNTAGLSMAVPAFLTAAAGGGFSAGVSNVGNTAGSTGISGTRMVLVGSQNISLSQSTDANGLTVSFSGGAGAAGNTGFISAGAATASLGTVVFSNSNGVSFGVNGQTVTASVSLTTQSAIKAFGASNTGNTAGNTGVSTGIDWVMAASNSLTISESTAIGGPNTLWMQVGAYLTTADLSANSSNYFRNWKLTGNTAGTTSSAQGTDLWLAGGNGVTVSGSSNTISLSVATNYQSQGAYLTTARASTDAIGLNTAQTNVTWTVNSSGISFNAGGYAGTGFTTATTTGTNLVGTQATNGLSLGVPAWITATGIQSAQSAIKGLGASNTGNTAGNTGVSTGIDWVLAGTNNITISESTAVGGPNTLWVSGNTAAGGAFSAGISTIGNTSGNTGVTGTRVVLAGGNNITLSQVTDANGATITVSAPNLGAGAMSAGASNLGNTAGATGITGTQLVFVGTGPISLSQTTGANGGTLSINAPPISTVSGTGIVSLSTNGSTLFIGAPSANNFYATSNTFGTSSGTGDFRTLSIAGSGGVYVAASNSGFVVSAAPFGTMSMYPFALPATTALSTYYSGSTSQGAGGGSTNTGYTFSIYVVPMPVDAPLNFSEIRIGASNARSTAGTGSVTHLFSVGLYTNNASTLSKFDDFYGGFFFSQNSITAQTYSVFTFSTGGATAGGAGGFAGLAVSTIYSSQGNISANSQMDGGVRFVRVDDGATHLLPPNQYYCALAFCSVSSSVNVLSNVGIMQSNAISSLNIMDFGRENNTQTSNYLPGWGAISTTFTSNSGAATFFPLPAAIPLANMSRSSSAWQRFHFPYMRNLS